MIIVTGGAGFIGSAVVWMLNERGEDDILVVDDLGRGEKWKNLLGRRFSDYLHKKAFLERLESGRDDFAASAVIHLGACSSTIEADAEYLMANNTAYAKTLCRHCLSRGAAFINASSAATYGDGSRGFDDDASALNDLRPLNMYGFSKHLFDLWADKEGILDRIVSLKFFNVFGPNEYHKGEMRSVVCKAYEQIKKTGRLKLFKSHREDYPHGGQRRDFYYVKDAVDLVGWFLEHPEAAGLFNAGSGRAETWNELAEAIFAAMGRDVAVDYIDMPEGLRGKYQYFTQARLDRLRAAGYDREATPLTEAVADYISKYLSVNSSYL